MVKSIRNADKSKGDGIKNILSEENELFYFAASLHIIQHNIVQVMEFSEKQKTLKPKEKPNAI